MVLIFWCSKVTLGKSVRCYLLWTICNESWSHWIYTPRRWLNQPRLAAVKGLGETSAGSQACQTEREESSSACFHNSIWSKVLSFHVRNELWRWGQYDRWLTDCPFWNLDSRSRVQKGKPSIPHPHPSSHPQKCTGFYRTPLQSGSNNVCNKSKELWKKIEDFFLFLVVVVV